MCLFTADAYEGSIKECDEGVLTWVPKSEILSLNLWEGDKWFLKLLEERQDFFTMKLSYNGDKLIEVQVDGKEVFRQ